MPPVSERQRRFMGAHQKDKGPLGKVAREYIGADPGGKLPKSKASKPLFKMAELGRKK
jgi:hypothetical protein